MCKDNNRLDIHLYDNKDLFNYLNKIEHVNNKRPEDKELISFLDGLFGKSFQNLPTLSPFLVNWIENRILGSSKLNIPLVKQSYVITMKDNAYNFAIAKTFNYLNGLKSLSNIITDKDELLNKVKTYSNLVFSTQQKTEDYQVEHMTDLINTVDTSSENLLEYVSERDGKVRPSHKAQDGTVTDKTDKYWTEAISLLSEYNCRCSIEQASPNAKKTATYLVGSKTETQPSDIDFQKGRAIIFSQNLPVFQNTTPIIRKQFKKNGF